LRGLNKRGHDLNAATNGFGTISALIRHRKGDVEAATDPRSDGSAEGF
jgi:gamma-glutamyltranspeptidase